jgi:hypothetical protein
MLNMAMSQAAALTIIAAYNIFKYSPPSGQESFFNEEMEVAEVRYRHALRRLKEAYPDEFSGFSDQSYMEILGWTVRLYSMGHRIPAAVAAAKRIGFPLEQMAKEFPADA